MKNFVFLFNNLQMFYLIGGLVLLNTILGIVIALREKNFSWSSSTDFIRLLGVYTVWLMLGNTIEYFTKLQGYEVAFVGLEISGFAVIAGPIVAKEVGKAGYKLKKLMPADSTETPADQA